MRSSADEQARVSNIVVRPSRERDLGQIQAILAHHVRTGTGTFDDVPPDIQVIAATREQVLAAGLPHLVAEADGRILGFAYAGPFRTRSGYRFTAEDSVYVRDGFAGRGIGRALLAALLEQTRAAGRSQMIAMIGDSANVASIGLHQAFGFERIGLLPGVGFKFGRWLDVVVMQRSLDPPVASEGNEL